MLETSDNSALITRIRIEEEVLCIHLDLLRVCPGEIGDEPVEVSSWRKRRTRSKRVIGVKAVRCAVKSGKLCCFRDDVRTCKRESLKRQDAVNCQGGAESPEETRWDGGDGRQIVVIIPAVLRSLKHVKRPQKQRRLFIGTSETCTWKRLDYSWDRLRMWSSSRRRTTQVPVLGWPL